MQPHHPSRPQPAANDPARAIAGPRLVAENGIALTRKRRPPRPRTPANERHRLEAEVVAGQAHELREAVSLYTDALRRGDPITQRALLREILMQAGYVYERAANLAGMIGRTAPGGAA